MKCCKKFKMCNYFKLLVFVLLNILLFQFIYLFGITKLSSTLMIKFFTCIIFLVCSGSCVIVTLLVEKKISSLDLLTGTYTRERMYYDLNKLIKNKRKILIMYIDLDNFKEINDLYGHLEGDKILKSFGCTISNLSNDIKSYRIGGDEFIIIITNNVEKNKKILNDFIKSGKFNFSYGISKFPDDTQECSDVDDIIENLISISDAKMYEKKFSKK